MTADTTQVKANARDFSHHADSYVEQSRLAALREATEAIVGAGHVDQATIEEVAGSPTDSALALQLLLRNADDLCVISDSTISLAQAEEEYGRSLLDHEHHRVDDICERVRGGPCTG